MEERSIVVDGDILVGNYVDLGFGLIAKTVVAGEHVKINGNILSENDVRIDMWSEVTGEVRAKANAYLGEFAKINGKLTAGNLNVGNNVQISEGYDVKGWIEIRNPLPVIMFIFFYMMALLRLGNEEEVDRALDELFTDETASTKVMSIPNRSKIDLETIRTASHAFIGNHCRLLGNIRARSASMGNHVTLFGSIRTTGAIKTGRGCIIHGNIDSKDKVTVSRNCRILGKITADSIIVHESSKIDGNMVAENGVTVECDDLEMLDDIEKKLFYGFLMLEDV
ncbi:MAG: acyltransferase [Candidatus Methanoperedens sp.]|nr:acyltransferase [Candidatus Methanoperedens sp.]MCE8428366.1 acyltransferase [Candidatus Methanoperedens sp.]